MELRWFQISAQSVVAALVVLSGCSRTSDLTPINDTDSDTDVVQDSGIDTNTPVDTADTGEPPAPIVVDCAALPQGPYTMRKVPGANGYHGIVFDGNGYLVGGDNDSLIKTAYDGTWSVLTPNVGKLQQIERLPSGDLVAGSDNVGGLIRIYQNGVSGFLADMYDVYGVRVGPDGMVYAANMDEVYRIDPATKAVEVYLPAKSGFYPKVLDFNKDFTKMYIGTVSGNGKVFAVDLDANLDPVGNPYLFATGVGGGWHDGLGVDVCGNLYVNDFDRSALYRVSPDGSVVEKIIEGSFWQGTYGHGLTWGSGNGSWSDHSIFMPLPYMSNQVVEVDLGVPYRDWVGGVVLNAP